MPHSITLQINPESLKFLTHNKNRLSLAQQTFMAIVKQTHQELSKLKEQAHLEFTANNESEISRGKFYAITLSLQEKLKEEARLDDSEVALENANSLKKDLEAALKKENSLEDLQAALENDLHINDKETLSFILLCLVRPVWLPGALSAIACSILTFSLYHCKNRQSDSLKAVVDGKHILFQLTLYIHAINDERSLPRGTITINFTIDSTTRQVKFPPIHMQFNFPDVQESVTFQEKLAKDFKGWLLQQDELAKIQTYQTELINPDRYVLPILLGLLIGLVAMASFTALSLSVISVLILPPLGLALGLILAILASGCTYLIRRKEEKKLQRPIYLFNKNPLTDSPIPMKPQTMAFFASPRSHLTAEKTYLAHRP